MTDHPVKSAYTFETIEKGAEYSNTRFVSDDDVALFAQVTGDDNPIHLDDEYARTTRFEGCIVHAVFLLGLISKVLGRDFPGPGSVAVTISCRFLRPVPVNSHVRVDVKIVEKLEARRLVRAKTYVYLEGNRMAVAGEVTFMAPGEVL